MVDELKEIVDELRRIRATLERISDNLPTAIFTPDTTSNLAFAPDVPLKERTTRDGTPYETWSADCLAGIKALDAQGRITNALVRSVASYPSYLAAHTNTLWNNNRFWLDPAGYLIPFRTWIENILSAGEPKSKNTNSPLCLMPNWGPTYQMEAYRCIKRWHDTTPV